MPAETHVERSPIGPDEVLAPDPRAARRDPRDRRGPRDARCELRRRPRRGLARADRAGRGARGGARRAHRRLQRRRRGPRRPPHRSARPSTTSWRAWAGPPGRPWTRTPSPGSRAPSGGRSATFRNSRVRSCTVRTARSTPTAFRTSASSSSATPCSGMVVTDFTFHEYPDLPEGELAKLRASVVNAEVLAELAVSHRARARAHAGQGRGRVRGPPEAVDPRRRDGGRDRGRLPRRRLGRGARPRACGSSRRASVTAPPAPGGHDYKTRLQELAARDFDQLPRYQVRSEGPDHSKQFFATVTLRGEVRGSGEGRSKKQAEQAAARDAWARLTEGATTAGRRPRQRCFGDEGAGCRSCLRSRSCAATSNARSSASGSRRSRSTGCAASAGTTTASSSSTGSRARSSPGSTGAGSTSCAGSTAATSLVVHLGMSGQLLRAKSSRDDAREAHARRDHVPAGRPAPLRRPADVRRDVRDRVRRRRGSGRRSSRTSASTRSTRAMSWEHFGYLMSQRHAEAQVAAHGPEVPGRDRQHLQRRDPLGRRSALGPHERLAHRPGGPPAVPRDDGDAAGRGEVPRLVARRRAVRRPLREARASSSTTTTCTRARASLPAVPAHDRPRSGSAAAPPSSARRARCELRVAIRVGRVGVGARAGRVVPGVVSRRRPSGAASPAGCATSPTGAWRRCSRANPPRSTRSWRGVTRVRRVPVSGTSSVWTSSRSKSRALPSADARRPPLDGIRVLDLTRVVAGPICGRMLADLGADVVKVEPPDLDITRTLEPKVDGQSAYSAQLNAGKRSIVVDLTSPDGPDLVARLAGRADVLLENFRPGVLDRFGLGPGAVARALPAARLLLDHGLGPRELVVVAAVVRTARARGRSACSSSTAVCAAWNRVRRSISTATCTPVCSPRQPCSPRCSSASAPASGQHLDVSMAGALTYVNEWAAVELLGYDGPRAFDIWTAPRRAARRRVARRARGQPGDVVRDVDRRCSTGTPRFSTIRASRPAPRSKPTWTPRSGSCATWLGGSSTSGSSRRRSRRRLSSWPRSGPCATSPRPAGPARSGCSPRSSAGLGVPRAPWRASGRRGRGGRAGTPARRRRGRGARRLARRGRSGRRTGW